MKRIILSLLIFTSTAYANIFSQADLELLENNFLANLQPNGAIVASPSQFQPNYYYDWIRDSAIAMTLIESWYEQKQINEYKARLYQYVEWTERLQHQSDPLPGFDILGEPKFYLDGYPFTGSWGRPQNDGPALRATVLTRFAQQLLKEKELNYVHQHLYNNSLDSQQMGCIKMDLEYIAHHWQEANYDLWEEVYGHHFFTAMTQQRALYEGAELARKLHDKKAAAFYETQAQAIESRLMQHLDPLHRQIKATLTPYAGPQKNLELDSAIVLGILFNPHTSGEFSPQSPYVKNTIHALHDEFNDMFPVNANADGAILFGRYPGDTYDGYQTNSQGNPWHILTAMMAEYYFTLADHVRPSKANNHLIRNYLQKGEDYLALIKHYAPELYLSEQINRISGNQQGAFSLTWSYVAVLRAIELQNKVEKKMNE